MNKLALMTNEFNILVSTDIIFIDTLNYTNLKNDEIFKICLISNDIYNLIKNTKLYKRRLQEFIHYNIVLPKFYYIISKQFLNPFIKSEEFDKLYNASNILSDKLSNPIGTCCMCKEDCNWMSQSCGHCARNGFF